MINIFPIFKAMENKWQAQQIKYTYGIISPTVKIP